VTTYFRLHPEDEDPQELLEPENQISKPWGGADRGRCNKCGGSGRTTFRCASCTKQADPRCEICHGDVEFDGDCPACRGTGEITEGERRGVSVFRAADGLYRYVLRRDADMAGSLVVELEGNESDDPDFDADEGALLVFPTRIVRATPLDRARIAALRGEIDDERAA
jgi:DnaJ-class molecular chaperone